MIKIICDRCGAEIKENEEVGYVAIGVNSNPLSDEAKYDAGWNREKIADEMGMTPNAVSNAVWLHKKKMAERGASDEKDRKEDIAAILQGS